MARLLLLLLHCLFFIFLFSHPNLISSSSSSSSFSFSSFINSSSCLTLEAGAQLTNSSTITLVPSSLLLYRKPITFLDLGGAPAPAPNPNPNPNPNPDFSTYFSFSLSTSSTSPSHFTFFLTFSSLSLSLPFMDLLHTPPPSVLSLTFTASKSTLPVQYYLHIRLAGLVLPIRIKLSPKENHLLFSNGQKLHSWIDYNGTLNRLQLRLAASTTAAARPNSPILSYPMDLSNVLRREEMVVGFTCSTDNNTTQLLANGSQNHKYSTLYQWSFVARRGGRPPYLMHSQPLDPSSFSPPPTHDKKYPSARRVIRGNSHPWALVLALIFAATCGAMLAFFALFVWFSVCAHRPVAPVEYPVHPAEVIYEKIVLVGLKDAPNSNHK